MAWWATEGEINDLLEVGHKSCSLPKVFEVRHVKLINE